MVFQTHFLIGGDDSKGKEILKNIINPTRPKDMLEKLNSTVRLDILLGNTINKSEDPFKGAVIPSFMPIFSVLHEKNFSFAEKTSMNSNFQVGLILVCNPLDPAMFLSLDSWIQSVWEFKELLPVAIILNDTDKARMIALEDELNKFCKGLDGYTSRHGFTISWYKLSELQDIDNILRQLIIDSQII